MLTLSNRSQFRTLLDAVALQDENDERPAIIYLETDQAPIMISRRDFRGAVMAHAAGLQHMGIQPHDLVIIAHTQNLESIYAFWGALWCGAIPSMFPTLTEKLDPDIYMHSMAELARLSEVRAVFTTDEFEPQLAARVPCQVFGSEHLARSVAIANGVASDTSSAQADVRRYALEARFQSPVLLPPRRRFFSEGAAFTWNLTPNDRQIHFR